MPRSIRATLGLLLVLLAAAPLHAQDPAVPPLVDEPIAPFVADARGVIARFKQLPGLAAAAGVESTDLPTRGLGLVVGAHLYPLRRPGFALGVGGELLLRARAGRTLPPATATGPDGPTVVTRMTALSPQVSLNFGKRDGWSYVSGGIGWASLTAERQDAPVGDPASRPRALNYGGGARWFVRDHLAFSIDLRFYAVNAQAVTATRPAYPKTTVMIFSAGIATR